MEEIKLLSLVVPSFRQEETIVEDILKIKEVLEGLSYSFEIIVVIDGAPKKTYCKLLPYVRHSKKIKVFKYKKNKGKGYAVRYGMLRSRGDIVGFIDAGMEINPSGIVRLIDFLKNYKADIVVASKLHPDSKVKYPIYRLLFSYIYRKMTHLLFGFQVRDTQVGFKIFRREVVDTVFPKLVVNNFAFDIEVLAIAYSKGFRRIVEGPVELDFNRASSITSANFWKIISHMIIDTILIFYRIKFTNYYLR